MSELICGCKSSKPGSYRYCAIHSKFTHLLSKQITDKGALKEFKYIHKKLDQLNNMEVQK